MAYVLVVDQPSHSFNRMIRSFKIYRPMTAVCFQCFEDRDHNGVSQEEKFRRDISARDRINQTLRGWVKAILKCDAESLVAGDIYIIPQLIYKGGAVPSQWVDARTR